jgi:hypothetical protein
MLGCKVPKFRIGEQRVRGVGAGLHATFVMMDNGLVVAMGRNTVVQP